MQGSTSAKTHMHACMYIHVRTYAFSCCTCTYKYLFRCKQCIIFLCAICNTVLYVVERGTSYVAATALYMSRYGSTNPLQVSCTKVSWFYSQLRRFVDCKKLWYNYNMHTYIHAIYMCILCAYYADKTIKLWKISAHFTG